MRTEMTQNNGNLPCICVSQEFFLVTIDRSSAKRNCINNKAVYTSQSRVRVGRGSDDKGLPKHLGRSSNAKTARNAKKAKCDRPTDRQTDRVGHRVACTRLKSEITSKVEGCFGQK